MIAIAPMVCSMAMDRMARGTPIRRWGRKSANRQRFSGLGKVTAMSPVHDVVIVGGGPAGLTAAVCLARYHLNPLVIDAGDSRAVSIPLSRNIAGFPAGIAGDALLGLDRISHAIGAGGVAATTIRNDLAAESPLLR